MLPAYMLYSDRRVIFKVIGSLEQRYAPQAQQTCFTVGDRVVAPEDAGDGVVALISLERSDTVHEALW